MRLPVTIMLLLILLGAGCAVGPHYQPPKIKIAPAFTETNNLVNTNEPVADWWREFHDPELDRLIAEVMRGNLDLQSALMRIRESRFQRNIAAADLFPTVDANGGYIHSRGSKNVILPLGGSSGGGSGGSSSKTDSPVPKQSGGSSDTESQVVPNPLSAQPNPFGQGGLPGDTTDLYQVGFDASWEIDVFGGKRRQVEAASAELGAAAQSRHALQVSLAAETARDYMELRGAQERLRIARENLNTQSNILVLTQSKRSVGLASGLDVVRARAQVDETASAIPPLETDTRRMAHALSILMGREPGELDRELAKAQPVPTTPPEVPIGLPSELLKRRADVRQAEREIAAASARIGAAQADLFPKFALIANAGLDSSSPGNLFNWESRYFLISPTATWRIFDSGRILSNIRLQRANEQEAITQYRNTILKALQDVEDALVNYASERIRRDRLAEQAEQSQEALSLARQQYDQGLVDFLSVLMAERDLWAAQDALAISSQAMSADLVALYKSLGGGWN